MLQDRIIVLIVFSFAILLSGVLFSQDALAVKSMGTKNPQTMYDLVCGDELCQMKMSSDEKIGMYLVKFLQEKNPAIFQQSRFAMSGVLQQGFGSPQQQLTADDLRLLHTATKKLQRSGIDIESYLSALYAEGIDEQTDISQQGIKPKLPPQVAPIVPKKEIIPPTNKDIANNPPGNKIEKKLDELKEKNPGNTNNDGTDPIDCTNLTPGAKLVGCDLHGMDLNGKDLHGADLRGANLNHADLRTTNLSYTDLSNATLNYADISCSLFVCGGGFKTKFDYADLSYANLRGAQLLGSSWYGANLNHADFSCNENTCAYLGEEFHGQNSVGGSDFTHANLNYTNFSGAVLFYSLFHYANLQNAVLSSAELSNSEFNQANLQNANLSGAKLRSFNLSGLNLSGANLSGANLSYAVLRGTNLSGADLTGTELSGADLSGANLIECTGYSGCFQLN